MLRRGRICCTCALLLSSFRAPDDRSHAAVQEASGLVLVTGAAGGVMGGTGRILTQMLLKRGVPVRALVRSDDDRAAALRAAGAEVPAPLSARAPTLLTWQRATPVLLLS